MGVCPLWATDQVIAWGLLPVHVAMSAELGSELLDL